MKCSCGNLSENECQALFHEILAREFSDVRYAEVHRLTVDAYSMQHPDRYMLSAKSYAAHLTGLCVAVEHGSSPKLLRKLQDWLNGRKELPKPGIPDNFGSVTIAYVVNAKDPDEHIRRVREWAQCIWDAWAEYQDLARHWVEVGRGKN